MTAACIPIKFVVGSRCLLSVSRELETYVFSLEDLVSGTRPPWPADHHDIPGVRVSSAPLSRFDEIRARYPAHLMGGFQSYERYYIHMAGKSYADYFGQFSSKTRSTFNRKRRKVADLSGGQLDVREFHRDTDVEPFMADAVLLSRRTYQTRLLDAGLPEGQEAVAAMKALARKDEIRAYILYGQGRPLSYLYLPTTGGIVTYAYLGYEPEAANLSVGTVLQMEVLKRLFAEGRYRYFDFTEGEGAHKKMFGTASVPACSFFLLKPSVRNRALITALNTFNETVATTRNLIGRTGALALVRRVLRTGK